MTQVWWLMHALAMAKKGRPPMTGIRFLGLGTGLVSSTMKSTGKKNLSTLMMASSTIPQGFLIDQSASFRIIVVRFNSPRPSY
jgi:hypothetical protein